LEFKAAGETRIHLGDTIHQVPCSKKTLLLNKNVPIKEKRYLMKLLQTCSKLTDDETEPSPADKKLVAAFASSSAHFLSSAPFLSSTPFLSSAPFLRRVFAC
jgi:RAB protein geranylgeranyltransferase component A